MVRLVTGPMETNLIQLVSEQTMPNVISALALRPASMVLLHTDLTERHCSWITRALSEAGFSVPTELVSLGRSPDHVATAHAVRTALQTASTVGVKPVVNVTGGTKLMSIGAFAAAHTAKVSCFYLDAATRRIHAGTAVTLPGPLDDPVKAFAIAAECLSVSVIATAHGVDQVTAGRDPAGWSAAAEILASDRFVEGSVHDFALSCLNEGKRLPADYVRLLNTPLDALPEALLEVLATHGQIVSRDERWYLWHPDPECIHRWAAGERFTKQVYFQATSPLQEMIAFLSGGWWELTVLDDARRSNRFRDIRWSPRCVRADGELQIEEDILAVEDLNLAVISCKRGGERNRVLRAFEETESARRQLGGSFACGYLAMAIAPSEVVTAELQRRLQSTRVRLISPSSRKSGNLFL